MDTGSGGQGGNDSEAKDALLKKLASTDEPKGPPPKEVKKTPLPEWFYLRCLSSVQPQRLQSSISPKTLSRSAKHCDPEMNRYSSCRTPPILEVPMDRVLPRAIRASSRQLGIGRVHRGDLHGLWLQHACILISEHKVPAVSRSSEVAVRVQAEQRAHEVGILFDDGRQCA
eukprot:CAMPEP_0196719986 /NCGR_PEP_ID=MMETSP1091-20130531/2871_1 /TAXON_ID=302021 /ORGANISM="Rhodomonas sp., Strain CCMP768" /LENGTH=170 /DNA_ID=CAMNT_0042061087 /DNA_START=183 /DNA_END=693 /DNA_ORIENTATION=+